MPKAKDTDGLSVSVKSKTGIAIVSLTNSGKHDAVVEFPAESVTKQGLTIVPDPTKLDDGHSYIPELNTAALKNSHSECHKYANALAEAASLVWHPDQDVMKERGLK